MTKAEIELDPEALEAAMIAFDAHRDAHNIRDSDDFKPAFRAAIRAYLAASRTPPDIEGQSGDRANLIDELRNKTAAIPEFDRGFSWEASDYKRRERFTGYGHVADLCLFMVENAPELAKALAALRRPVPTDAVEALRNHQQQLDQDGVMVGVSRQALDEVLAALSAAPYSGAVGSKLEQDAHTSGAVKVKALEWEPDVGTDGEIISDRARTPFGWYFVERDTFSAERAYEATGPYGFRQRFPNEASAFNAAQADYERRILSTLASGGGQ